MRLRHVLTALALLGLAACGQDRPAPTRAVADVGDVSSVAFGDGRRARGVPRSNIALAEDFLDLTFALERGEQLSGLLRHESPVRVYVRPGKLQGYSRDIENLLARFRAEAGIDIARVSSPEAAQIFIDGVLLRDLQKVDSGAACFIVPGVKSWAEFRAKGPRSSMRWSAQRTLGVTGIFIPVDTFPQDVRDCLHEELAQALGPANDLYRLPDSVFNDDNFHSVVTPFDMLILRALYDPELRSGMPRQVVAGKIVGILDRINPGGKGRGSLPRAPSSAAWKTQIETALTRRNADLRRRAAANRAVDIARAMRPTDHRLGVALITRGRLTRERDPGAAAQDFIEAYQRFRTRLGENDIRTAQAALHVALVALSVKDFDQATKFSKGAIRTAREGQNAVLLSSLLAVQAAALNATGNREAARAAQLDHLRWARYAYGDGNGERRRAQAELEALSSVALE